MAVWLFSAVAGLSVLSRFDNAPGIGANAPARWPADSVLARTPGHGFEATSQLKHDAATRHIPIIVLSAHAMTNDRDMALAAGGDDFDTKPVRFEQLLGKIESLLPKAVIE
jgi:CheY-like chemotaxis protein